MTTTYGKLGYCFRVLGFLECRPFAVRTAKRTAAGTTVRRPTETMHLVACQTPQEPLEDAPMSALLGTEVDAGDQWNAFWSRDATLVRCINAEGSVEWFGVGDEPTPSVTDTRKGRSPTSTRVIEFPLRRLQ